MDHAKEAGGASFMRELGTGIASTSGKPKYARQDPSTYCRGVALTFISPAIMQQLLNTEKQSICSSGVFSLPEYRTRLTVNIVRIGRSLMLNEGVYAKVDGECFKWRCT